MTVYVVLYENSKTGACKVSQEGYKTLLEAQKFCMSRWGVPSTWEPDPDKGEDVIHVYYRPLLGEKYTIVEVSV